MKAFLMTVLVILTLSQATAQDKQMIYKLYEKTGRELSKKQLDSLEAIHKRLHFEYHNTPEEFLVIVNLVNEQNIARQEGDFQFQTTQEEDGSYKTSVISEKALRQKWMGKDIFSADLKDADRNTFALGTKSDRVTVLNLWYTGCAPCIREMPDLNELVGEFAGDKVDFLALTFDSKKKVTKFMKKRQFDYQVIPDAREHLAKIWVRGDSEDESISAIYPVHFVIDQNGVVQEMILGAKEDIKELLRKAIQAQL